MLWMYLYQSLFRLRQVSIFQFQALQILSVQSSHLLIFLLHKVFLSFLILQRRELNLRMTFVPVFAPICQSSVGAKLIYRNHCAEKHLVSLIIVESGKLLAIFFDV